MKTTASKKSFSVLTEMTEMVFQINQEGSGRLGLSSRDKCSYTWFEPLAAAGFLLGRRGNVGEARLQSVLLDTQRPLLPTQPVSKETLSSSKQQFVTL